MSPEMILLALAGVTFLVFIVYLGLEASHQKTAHTKVVTAKAIVVDMDYVAPKTTTTYGLKYDGKMGMKTSTTPEKHHVWIYVEDLQRKLHWNSERLYQMLRLDDTVDIEYQEEYSYDDRKPQEIKFEKHRIISVTSPKGRKYVNNDPEPETYTNGRLTPKVN